MTTTLPYLSSRLRSYQIEGIKLGLGQACCGWLMKPGHGKTAIAMMVFRILQDQKFVRRMLVVAPIRPMYVVWPAQPETWAEFQHLSVRVAHGSKWKEALLDDDADVVVINPESLHKLDEGIVRERFQMLVVDESTKFKNSQTKRFKLMREIVKWFKRRYIMTGTFTAKGLHDLFGQVYVLDQGAALGAYITHYRNRYFYKEAFGYDWLPQPDAEERIRHQIAPLTYVVDHDLPDVPRVLVNDIIVELPTPIREFYRHVQEELMLGPDEEDALPNEAVAASKLLQIAAGFIYRDDRPTEILHDEKITEVENLVEQMGGAPILFIYTFEATGARLPFPSISTGNPKKDAETIAAFSRGELVAAKGQISSVALGIDGLQRNCADICLVDPTYRTEDYAQVIRRVARAGSKARTVTLHRILARGTRDMQAVRTVDNELLEMAEFLELLGQTE